MSSLKNNLALAVTTRYQKPMPPNQIDRTYQKLVFKAFEVFQGALLHLHDSVGEFDISEKWQKKIVKINRMLIYFEEQRSKGPHMSDGFKKLAESIFLAVILFADLRFVYLLCDRAS